MVVAAIAIVVAAPWLVRAAGAFLVVEQPPEPATAIVVLGGSFPLREMAAAALYRQGWAPRVVLVREWEGSGERALAALGVPTAWERRTEVLRRSGVPPDAILAVDGAAYSTLDELQRAAAAIGPADLPVLLVSSKYHARRVGVTWARVTGGSPRGVVQSPPNDAFSPDGWWKDHRMILQVFQEYAGLVDAWLGFPFPRNPGRQ